MIGRARRGGCMYWLTAAAPREVIAPRQSVRGAPRRAGDRCPLACEMREGRRRTSAGRGRGRGRGEGKSEIDGDGDQVEMEEEMSERGGAAVIRVPSSCSSDEAE